MIEAYEKKILLLTACICVAGLVTVTGCSSEPEIIPSGFNNPNRFDFPEGDEVWDEMFENFFDDYGTRIIYKGWETSDFERSWLSGGFMGGANYQGSHYSDPQKLTQIANFLKDKVFDFLPEEWDFKNMIFPPTIYLVDNFTMNREGWEYNSSLDNNLGYYMDCWMISPADSTLSLQNAPATMAFCGRLFRDYIRQAYNRKRIVIPDEFDAEVNWNTPTVQLDEQIDNANYYLRRGLVDEVAPTLFRSLLKPDATNEGAMARWRGEKDFMAYVTTALFFPDFTEVYKDWPLVIKRHNFLVEYLKTTYEIDLHAISRAINLVDENQ